MLTCLVPVLFAFYLQSVPKFKCKIPAPNVNTLKFLRKKKPKNSDTVHAMTHDMTQLVVSSTSNF